MEKSLISAGFLSNMDWKRIFLEPIKLIIVLRDIDLASISTYYSMQYILKTKISN